MTTIRAAVCRAFGAPLSVEELTLRPPAPDEVEVRISACAVCHSDISYIDGGWGGPLPTVFGHEAAGTVERAGAAVRGYAPGDRVIVTLMRHCGSCHSCIAGHEAMCEAPPSTDAPYRDAAGAPVAAGMATGAFAERVLVHPTQIAPLPGEMPMEAAALMACGVITGVGAVVNEAGIRPGQDVVVIGAGGVGLNAIQGARLSGAARIIAVDMTEEKLATARAFGATHGVLATGAKPWKEARAIAGRGADAVFVTVGALAAHETATRYLARGGTAYLVGMPHDGQSVATEPVILAALGQGLKGCKMGDTRLARDIPWMAELYRQGRLELDGLISGRWPLEKIDAAIADTRSGGARRNVILF